MILKKLAGFFLALTILVASIPLSAMAAGNSTVILHPSVNHTVTGVKVKVGDTIDGHPVTKISGYDITVDLGKYNVNNDRFRLPYARELWTGVDNNKVDYISWAGSGSNQRSEGASALLANGENTAYYYFKGAPSYLTFTLKYDANGGTGAPATQTYTATSPYEKSHTFTISGQQPTREGFTFLGWSTDRNATTAERQPGGSIVVTGTTTLYAVWQEQQPAETYTVTYKDGANGTAFADQVYSDLKAGDATPAFNGTPQRTGYTFVGWSPAVTDTVMDNATYTAQWEQQPAEIYTVTYTDGANGEAFPDQVYSNLKAGEATPAFNGTPQRTGYTFVGWSPAVTDTVMGNATYTAQWKQQPATTYTVTYKDGANGKAFPDQVYSNLKAGDPTPAFNGTPQRTGYTFVGWSPAVTDTVTGNATYTAQWKQQPAATYTVTYKDGANGTAFADQVYSNLKAGEATPAFKGTPQRTGYTFVGWSPAVANTVTGNATYTARWNEQEKPVPPVGPDSSGQPPKTGDDSHLLLWAALMLLAGGGMVGLLLRKRIAHS